MSQAVIIEGVKGFGSGYSFMNLQQASEEALQGKNYYISALYQPFQWILLSNLVQKVARTAFQGFIPARLSIFLQTMKICVIPFTFGAAVAKEHPEYFPSLLGSMPKRVLSFYAIHSGSLLYLAFAAGTCALFYLGQLAYASPILALLAYQQALALQLIPHKVNLFLEKYLPIVTCVGLFFEEGVFFPLCAGIDLITRLPSVKRLLYHKVDLLSRHAFLHLSESFEDILNTPSLEEYEAPLVERRDVKMEEINQILTAAPGEYEINPAHCSKELVDRNALPQNRSFDALLTLYDQTAWDGEYAVICKKMKGDERFLDELSRQFPSDNVKERFDELLDRVSQRQRQSKAQYCAAWCRQQMTFLVQGLKGERRVEGSAADLDKAIEDVARVLAYLQKLENANEKKDLLLKLTIEAGDYCAAGKRRVAAEIVDETIIPKLLSESSAPSDMIKNYEQRLLHSLQNQRRLYVQDQYNKLVKSVGIPNRLSSDVHIYDLYFCALSMGFYPVPETKGSAGFTEALTGNVYAPFRKEMIEKYLSDGLIQAYDELGILAFSNYVRALINSLPSLSEPEKVSLVERFASPPAAEESKELTNLQTIAMHNLPWQRLVLVILGVLRPRNRR